MNKRNILKWIIFGVAIATNLFILANSCVYGDASTAESSAITGTAANLINGIVPNTINNSNAESFIVLIRKVFGHFGLFAFSGAFSTWAFYLFCSNSKLRFFAFFGSISLLFGFTVAWISEFIQLFIPGRSGSVMDVGINFLGYFIGVLLVIFIIFLAKKPIFQKDLKQEK